MFHWISFRNNVRIEFKFSIDKRSSNWPIANGRTFLTFSVNSFLWEIEKRQRYSNTKTKKIVSVRNKQIFFWRKLFLFTAKKEILFQVFAISRFWKVSRPFQLIPFEMSVCLCCKQRDKQFVGEKT